MHVVAIPPHRDDEPVRSFRTVTTDLKQLADWLVQCRVTTVALESTGVFWIPVYEILEAREIVVQLVNARHLRILPGRKGDVLDSEWLRDLHSVGLLRGSCRPTADIVALRTCVRHRQTLGELAAMHGQRMHKALAHMNLKLPAVVSEITGVTGLRVIRRIAARHRLEVARRPPSFPQCSRTWAGSRRASANATRQVAADWRPPSGVAELEPEL